ncbi:MAG: HAMP domain-containing histidine kinase [Cyclobacteriaceae bacterium]
MSFRLHIFLRLLILSGLSFIAWYLFFQTPYWLAACWCIFFFLILFWELIRYLSHAHSELTSFLSSIQHQDFTQVFPEDHKRSKELHEAFNIITKEYAALATERQSNFLFLKNIVEHSGVPLIAYGERGDIELINESALQLLDLPHVTKIETIGRVSEDLLGAIQSLSNGKKQLVKCEIRKSDYQLLVSIKEILISDELFKVVAMHNINTELDEKEIESWQKLIRVLTHEIKNSVIPIATLAEVLKSMLVATNHDLSKLTKEEEKDLTQGVSTIEKRSKGLVDFVAAYSDLTRIPEPALAFEDLHDVINSVVALQVSIAEKIGVHLQCKGHKLSAIQIDKKLIEQVLINLIQNAIDVMPNGGSIHISLQEDQNRQVIVVRDSGPGIPAEILDQIFIPFFTTKEKGSGIGLSLSRQIIRAHGGNITVDSSAEKGTKFRVIL